MKDMLLTCWNVGVPLAAVVYFAMQHWRLRVLERVVFTAIGVEGYEDRNEEEESCCYVDEDEQRMLYVTECNCRRR